MGNGRGSRAEGEDHQSLKTSTDFRKMKGGCTPVRKLEDTGRPHRMGVRRQAMSKGLKVGVGQEAKPGLTESL